MNCFADVSKLVGSFETPKTWAKFGSIEPPAGRIKKDPFWYITGNPRKSGLTFVALCNKTGNKINVTKLVRQHDF
jgi:hypothetical protein